jgi:hypothetical protein
MLQGVKNGWGLIKHSIKVFEAYPKLLAPLMISWVFYGAIILYVEFSINIEALEGSQPLLLVFAIIFAFAFLLTFSASVLLEMVEQHESGEQINLSTAFKDTFVKNSYRLLPIVFIWTVIWFILVLIEAMLSSDDDSSGGDQELATESAAQTLAGSDNASFLSLSFDALKKGVRMIVFLVLPAVAWEQKGPWQSIKRGLSVFKNNLSEFATGYVLTGAISLLVFLPIGLVLFGNAEMGVKIPQWGWLLVIAYTAFAWSYKMYLEQMFTASLYLWYLKWEEVATTAESAGRARPSIDEVPRPSLLDNTDEFVSSPPKPPSE